MYMLYMNMYIYIHTAEPSLHYCTGYNIIRTKSFWKSNLDLGMKQVKYDSDTLLRSEFSSSLQYSFRQVPLE